MLRRPLQHPYDGPFKVLQRKDKVFFLDINGKRVSVSIDRCKPAFFLNTEDLQLPQTKNETPATVEPNATASTPATVESDPTASTPTQPSTRSGRKVHLPTSEECLTTQRGNPIPSSILENWNKFTKESKYLNSISIPRFMGIDQNSDIILHGFCDASTKAYAAVVYLKSKQEIHLVSAKTRVAPIKQLTIPRLELCGALLLAELISVIQKHSELNQLNVFMD
ncbi:uncharacterized protein TNCV_3278561 [Trichonephila clavipes]|nr:uncharacterized protein TNCV_3278561 [Trichonephila clavipes]